MRLQLLLLCAVGLPALFASPGIASAFSFETVADTNTSIPNGSGAFVGFGAPSLNGDDVTFTATGAGQVGIYARVGGTLQRIADLATAIPDGSGNFTDLLDPSIGGPIVVFEGLGSSGQNGIYQWAGGAVGRVADKTVAVPGGSGNFLSFGPPATTGGLVVFWARGPFSQWGVYSDIGGGLDVIQDKTDGFSSFGDPSIYNDSVAYTAPGASSGEEYVIEHDGVTPTTVASHVTAIPDGTGTFVSFEAASLGQGAVAFIGQGSSGQKGIYSDASGQLRTVVDLATASPTFTDLDHPSSGGGRVAFLGNVSGTGLAIYLGNSAVRDDLERVIGVGDPLLGSTVTALSATGEMLSGDRIAFQATLADGTTGIYLATDVPPPVTVPTIPFTGLLLLAAMLLLVAQLRRPAPL